MREFRGFRMTGDAEHKTAEYLNQWLKENPGKRVVDWRMSTTSYRERDGDVQIVCSVLVLIDDDTE